MKNQHKISLLIMTISFVVVNAQQKDIVTDSLKTRTIEEVVVTATRTEKKLSEVPVPITVITNQELQRSNSTRLSDILNEQTGIVTVPGHPEGEGFQLQGLGDDYILILLDGAPIVGRINGTLDLNRLAVGNIERIEIVKGASSSLYGNEALGGVVNIITKKNKKGFFGDIGYRISSLNVQDINANGSYQKDNFGISAFVNSRYDLEDKQKKKNTVPYIDNTYGLKLSYKFTEKDQFLFSGRYYNQIQKAFTYQGEALDARIKEYNLFGKYEHKFNKKFNSYLEWYVTEHYAFSKVLKTNQEMSRFKNLLIRPELRLFYKFNKNHTLTGGGGVTYEKLQKAILAKDKIEFKAPFVHIQYDGEITPTTNLILGARFDGHNEYKSQLSPKLAIRQDIIKNKLAFKGSVGYGYKAPELRKLYYDFTNSSVGYSVFGHNVVAEKVEEMQQQGIIYKILHPLSEFKGKGLKPESSINYNLGLSIQPLKGFNLNLNVFRNDIENLIDIVTVAQKISDAPHNGRPVFSYRNVGKVRTEGVEVTTSYQINKNLIFKGGYQLLYAYSTQVKDLFKEGKILGNGGKKLKENDYFGLLNRSRHMYNVKLFYKNFKWKFDTNLRLTHRSKYGFLDANGNGYLDNEDNFVNGYHILDFAFNKTFNKKYKIGLGINNALNFRDTKNIQNIPGEIYYGTVKVNF